MKNLNLILDGNNIAFRAYHVIANRKYENFVDISTIEQYFRILKSYINTFQPDDIFIAWDKKENTGGFNFRRELVPYKENRDVESTTVQDIHQSISIVADLCDCMGIHNFYPWNLEADDVISFLQDNLDGNNIIVSSDQDLLQLIDSNTTIYNTTKKEEINVDNFEEFVGVPRDNFVDYKSIMGDKSDNILGLKGYGKVKSKKLAISKNWELLDEDQINIIKRNKKIMDLKHSYEKSEGEIEWYENQLNKYKNKKLRFKTNKFNEICDEYSLKFVKRNKLFWESSILEKKLMEDWFCIN